MASAAEALTAGDEVRIESQNFSASKQKVAGIKVSNKKKATEIRLVAIVSLRLEKCKENAEIGSKILTKHSGLNR